MSEERRLSHRFTLRFPVTLVLPDSGLKIHGKTRDISSGGIFFYANLPIVVDQEVELLMTLPDEFAVVPVRVACRAKVLRVEHNDGPNHEKGMAAVIQRFDYLEDVSSTLSVHQRVDPI